MRCCIKGRWAAKEISADIALAKNTAMPYTERVRTVAETAIFQRYASEVWSEAERVEFINWIAANPDAGDVIRGSGGCRKVRWTSAGQGKRGGAKVSYISTRIPKPSGF
jgi:hypothetical protein